MARANNARELMDIHIGAGKNCARQAGALITGWGVLFNFFLGTVRNGGFWDNIVRTDN